MNQRVGTYITQNIGDEAYKAYVPPKLLPNPPVDLSRLYPSLEKAAHVLAELKKML